jgi:multiple sugar transport system substrate-binding protein
LPRFVLQGILLDITPYLEASELISIDDLAPANNYFVVDGAYYGMAKDWSPDFSLFISNNAFEEAGLEIPSTTEPLTYEQVGELARQLTVKEGDRTLRYGYGYGFLERQVQLMLAEKGVSLYSEDFKEIHITDNPDAIEALRWFYDLAVDGVIPTPLDPAATWTGQTFMDGQYGIISYGYWFSGMVTGATEESPVYNAVTMLPAPTWTGEARYNPTWGPTGIAIAADSKHPDEAFRFFEWFNAGDPALARAASGWGVPALNSLQDLMPTETPFQQAALEQVQNEMAVSDFVIPVNPYYDSAVFTSTWELYLEDALRGTIDFDEMLELVEVDVNAAIRDGVIAAE